MRLSPNNDLFIINRRVRITTLMFAHKNKTNDFINDFVLSQETFFFALRNLKRFRRKKVLPLVTREEPFKVSQIFLFFFLFFGYTWKLFDIHRTFFLRFRKVPFFRVFISKHSVLPCLLNNSRPQLAEDLQFSPIDRRRQRTQVYKGTKNRSYFEGAAFSKFFRKPTIHEIVRDCRV